jgi:hypothetical protein
MHRVDMKKRRTLILRYTAYSVTLLLSIITTIILIFVAQGYRLNKTGEIVRSGLLLVNNTPEAGQVYINGELKDSATPSRFVLKAGNYELSLERQGYRGWKKQVDILASGVEEAYYPKMVPTTLTPRTAFSIPPPSMTSQSLNRQLALVYSTGENNLRLLELNAETPTQTTLELPSSVKRENGQLGGFTVIEWSLNNRFVLLQQSLPSGGKELLSLNVNNPDETINITSLYGAETPENVHYRGGNTAQIYGVKDGTLGIYQLNRKEREVVLERVRNYEPFGTEAVAFARTNSTNTQVEYGLTEDDKATVIRRAAIHDGQDFVAYAEYDTHFYFATANTKEKNVIIYRDPLKTPVLRTQLPFATLTSDPPLGLEFSPGSEFLLAQSGNKANVYDFEHIKPSSFTLAFEPKAEVPLRWIDNWRLVGQQTDGMVWVVEYDGANDETLVKVREGSLLWFSDDYEHAYRLFETNGTVNFDTVSLVLNQP